MNRKQRRVIWVAISLLAVAFLIPPWQGGERGAFTGYAPLFFLRRSYGQQRINVTLLLTEALFITLAAVAAVVALGNKTGLEK